MTITASAVPAGTHLGQQHLLTKEVGSCKGLLQTYLISTCCITLQSHSHGASCTCQSEQKVSQQQAVLTVLIQTREVSK